MNSNVRQVVFLLGNASLSYFDPLGKLHQHLHCSFTVETRRVPDLMIMIIFFLERRRMRKVPMQLLRITSRRQM